MYWLHKQAKMTKVTLAHAPMFIKLYPKQTNKQTHKNTESERQKKQPQQFSINTNNNHITFRNELVPFVSIVLLDRLFFCAQQWRMRLFCYGNYLDSIYDMLGKVHTPIWDFILDAVTYGFLIIEYIHIQFYSVSVNRNDSLFLFSLTLGSHFFPTKYCFNDKYFLQISVYFVIHIKYCKLLPRSSHKFWIKKACEIKTVLILSLVFTIHFW